MQLRAFLSGLMAISHISLMVWYYSQPPGWQQQNHELASMVFFGIGFILIGANMFIGACNIQFPIQVEITKFHSVFVLLLGTIYVMHYSGLMTTTNKEKLIMICAGVLVILIIILISAYRHGFFKRETYDL